ncbi:hypothetical protein LCGC14_1751130 [marine sediment metagenome]|uniref:Uncharacterized protein n=1 Tax=marine sediment metagenome TaxID=412755 RepID=A0A0F9HR54_9ZZZZ
MAGAVSQNQDLGTEVAAIQAVTDLLPDGGALSDVATILAAVDTEVAAILAAVDTEIADIKTVTDAIPTLTETGDTLTADGTEQDVYINNAPSGLFRPICVKIDFTAHTGTETVTLKVYYRIKSGGNMILQDEVEYAGLVSPELINIELEPNRYGVQVTLQKTAGANRDYDWEVFYEA